MGFTDILLVSVAEIFGDFSLRWYAQSNAPSYLWGGILGYVGVIYYLIKSFRSDNVLYVNGMWDGVSSIVESVAAYVILGDRLERPLQYVGLLMTIAGIYLLKH
jgi:multidrug transporter EmrE-like cation transporter